MKIYKELILIVCAMIGSTFCVSQDKGNVIDVIDYPRALVEFDD